MNSRERVLAALNHEESDRVPIDLGGCVVTGMHVSTVYRLRQALKLDESGTPVKVIEPCQTLGEIALDLVERLGVDVLPLNPSTTIFGYQNQGWKPWTAFDGTPVLVPEAFNTEPESNGDILMYPEGDRSAQPSGRMPCGGWFFDAIVRQPPIVDDELNIEDNLEEFGPIGDMELQHFRSESERLYSQTDKAILANFGGTGFGDIALVPAPWLKHPKGIRDIEEWYISVLTRRDYVYRVFERQCEIALANLQRIYDVVGNRIAAVLVTGTDFGAQCSAFISAQTYRDMYKPFHRSVNDWIHANTQWKTMMHSCGSMMDLLPDVIDAGFDILNPVQTTAAGMDPRDLKEQFGDQLTFWGGAVSTQTTLPFGTPEQVRDEVRERISVFMQDGGFIFSAVHNIQARVPIENLLAYFETVEEFRHA